MVAGGIIYRLVTPRSPGEPSLDDPSTELQFRREYYCGGNPAWTKDREEAKFFRTHLEADDFSKVLGGGCHARVATPIDQEAVPESLQPLPEPEIERPPSPSSSRTSGKRPARRREKKSDRLQALREAHNRVVVGEDWVRKTYG